MHQNRLAVEQQKLFRDFGNHSPARAPGYYDNMVLIHVVFYLGFPTVSFQFENSPGCVYPSLDEKGLSRPE